MSVEHWTHHHVGRSFSGHPIEDECPCPQEPCGLVARDRVHPDCKQHTLDQTIRQGHAADACPASSPTREDNA